MRLFIGIEIDGPVRDAVMNRVKPIKSRAISWVPSENLHLTLRFLGSVPPERVGAVKACLRKTVASASGFDLILNELGRFPAVIWIAAAKPDASESKELRALALGIEAAITGLGFPAESKPFVPHVTIGRIKERGHESIEIPNQPGWTSPAFQVRSIALFESKTLPERAKYTVLERFSLPTEGEPCP